MAASHAFCLLIVVSLFSFAFPATFTDAVKLSCPRFLSFQLHLQPPTPLNLHNATSAAAQPLTPHLFSELPLFHNSTSKKRSSHEDQAHEIAGSARGLYLTNPAASSMEPCYLFFTATLQELEGGGTASEGADGGEVEGSLVLMGSVGAGAISVVGGTRAFAFASGQAKVSIAAAAAAAAGSDHVMSSGRLIISFDVELRYEQEESSEDAIAVV